MFDKNRFFFVWGGDLWLPLHNEFLTEVEWVRLPFFDPPQPLLHLQLISDSDLEEPFRFQTN